MISLGLDFGTSGARAIVISQEIAQRNCDGSASSVTVIAQSSYRFDNFKQAASPCEWQRILWRLIASIPLPIRAQVERIAVNGTSATMLLCNRTGQPLMDEALMYDDAVARSVLCELKGVAPANSPVLSATSTLAKALWCYRNGFPSSQAVDHGDVYIAHQADWIAALMHGQMPVSDYHNALKLGYDVGALAYPDWLLNLPIANWLLPVVEPGTAIAPISAQFAKYSSLPRTCCVCAGTTDSIAAFLASNASQLGDAVTSLGSTLVLKLLSEIQIDNSAFGIYSHRLGDLWLVGGASNTGGAVLQKYFSPHELTALSAQIDLSEACALNYYPLTSAGERFPINDPDYPPKLTPRPEHDVDFLYGMLNAISRIESEGYRKLQTLGAPTLSRVYTAGGGAKNEKWQLLRARHLGVKVHSAENTEAAYGTAKLALNGLSAFSVEKWQTEND